MTLFEDFRERCVKAVEAVHPRDMRTGRIAFPESSYAKGYGDALLNAAAAVRTLPIPTLPADVGELVGRLREWAVQIRNDGTPSQVGPTADELLAIAEALAKVTPNGE